MQDASFQVVITTYCGYIISGGRCPKGKGAQKSVRVLPCLVSLNVISIQNKIKKRKKKKKRIDGKIRSV